MRELLSILRSKELTIGSVESITGGAFADAVTNIPGASEVYKGSIVSYSVEEKINLLGLDSETIKENGVVSRKVSEEMAVHGRHTLNVDVCVSVTGNAGPTAEPGAAPVGVVFMSIALEDKVISKNYSFTGSRIEIKQQAVLAMREFLENTILENF